MLKVVDLSLTSGASVLLDKVSFSISPGEAVGLVGASGSGKSLTCRAIMGLLPDSLQNRLTGSIKFDDQELVGLPFRAWLALRGRAISYVFQDPLAYLHPLYKVGWQIVEALRLHQSLSKKQAYLRALDLVTAVGLKDPLEKLKVYPHELSGGQRQRVMIAMALANGPRLFIADEPTTALDTLTQHRILKLLGDLMKENPKMSILLVSHDLGVVATLCTRLLVMQGGKIVERGPVKDICRHPEHPYTKSLLAAVPSWGPRSSLEVHAQ